MVKAKKNFLKKYRGLLKLAFLVVFASFLMYLTSFDLAFIYIVFTSFFVFNLSVKYIAQATIVCLVMAGLLQLLERFAQAAQVAGYAFFLLVVTVLIQLIELNRAPLKAESKSNALPQIQEAFKSKLACTAEKLSEAAISVNVLRYAQDQKEKLINTIIVGSSYSLRDSDTQLQTELDLTAQETKVPIEPLLNIVGKDVSKPKRKKVGSEISKPKLKKTKPVRIVVKRINKKPNQK